MKEPVKVGKDMKRGASYQGIPYVWVLVFGLLLSPLATASLYGKDLPGFMTYRGRVVDAETSEPIEGAVVVAYWERCWPGLGAGTLCDVDWIKESMTDEKGEWSITGPKGVLYPSIARQVLGFLVRWTRPPFFLVYKPGYYKWGGDFYTPRGFLALPYIGATTDVRGIVIIDNEEVKIPTEPEKRCCMDTKDDVPFYSFPDPFEVLRTTDFSFRQNTECRGVPRTTVNFWSQEYWVLGLRKITSPKERAKDRLPGGLLYQERMPMLMKVIAEEMKTQIK